MVNQGSKLPILLKTRKSRKHIFTANPFDLWTSGRVMG